MPSEDQNAGYRIWAVDNVVYGPVELPAMVSWIKEERVTAETWVYVEAEKRWSTAASVPEFALFFRRRAGTSGEAGPPVSGDARKGLEFGVLRRVKILSGFSDEELERLMKLFEVMTIPQWSLVVKKGDHGDAMFLVLNGELRVRLMIDDRESTLATLGAGDIFGEISLFDHGPRSADVLANLESTLIKVSAAGFDKLMQEAPDLAARFLLATTRTLTARIRLGNKRYQDSIHIAHATQ